MVASRKTYYKDINLSFKPHPITGAVPVLKNEQAVKRAVRNVVLTNHYEKPYQPEYGGNIRAKLFENMDFFTSVEIHDQIEEAIRNHEPRAKVVNIIVDPETDLNGVNVTIIFQTLNQLEPVELNVFLQRVR